MKKMRMSTTERRKAANLLRAYELISRIDETAKGFKLTEECFDGIRRDLNRLNDLAVQCMRAIEEKSKPVPVKLLRDVIGDVGRGIESLYSDSGELMANLVDRLEECLLSKASNSAKQSTNS